MKTMKAIEEMLNIWIWGGTLLIMWLLGHMISFSSQDTFIRVGDHLESATQWGLTFNPLKALNSVPPLAGHEVQYFLVSVFALLAYCLFRLGVSLLLRGDALQTNK